MFTRTNGREQKLALVYTNTTPTESKVLKKNLCSHISLSKIENVRIHNRQSYRVPNYAKITNLYMKLLGIIATKIRKLTIRDTLFN